MPFSNLHTSLVTIIEHTKYYTGLCTANIIRVKYMFGPESKSNFRYYHKLNERDEFLISHTLNTVNLGMLLCYDTFVAIYNQRIIQSTPTDFLSNPRP
jgi:hypothetical protein